MANELLETRRITKDELITVGDLENFRKAIVDEIKELLKSQGSPPPRQWLRSSEVRKILHVSVGTLQNLRINGTLPYTKIGSIVYYRWDDINKVLEKNLNR